MQLNSLREIQALVEAKYEVRRQAFQNLVKRENELRSEIRRIDEQAAGANARSDTEMQSIGADVIWKSWVGKAKLSLNRKLALVLAEKEQHIRQVKQAYGKVVAAEKLVDDLSAQERKSQEVQRLSAALDMSLDKR
ncbi:hypothetical protein [Roseobacter sp.]|uniref:hypothetical protein n=1 Tax=Roseobacter sp. TaxID=1907202 RepID=UPI00385D67F2